MLGWKPQRKRADVERDKKREKEKRTEENGSAKSKGRRNQMTMKKRQTNGKDIRDRGEHRK